MPTGDAGPALTMGALRIPVNPGLFGLAASVIPAANSSRTPPSRLRGSRHSPASEGCVYHSLPKDQQQQPQALPNTDQAKAA
jgi:hypothetical protein